MNNEIQPLLDSITDQVGAMLVRSTSGWIGLQPGNPGDVLTMQPGTGLPAFDTPAPSSLHDSASGIAPPAAWDNSFANFKSIIIQPLFDVYLTAFWWANHYTGQPDYNLSIYELSGSTIAAITADIGPIPWPSTADQFVAVPIATPIPLIGGTDYAIGPRSPTSANNYQFSSYYSTSQYAGLPIADTFNVENTLLANPGIGDTITRVPGFSRAFGMTFRW